MPTKHSNVSSAYARAPKIRLTTVRHAAPTQPLAERIQTQRETIFSAMAMIAVSRNTLDAIQDEDARSVLYVALDLLNGAALALDDIASEAAHG